MRMSSPSRHRFSVARLSSAEFRSSLNGIRHNHYRKVPWGDFSEKSNFFEMALFPPYSLRSPSLLGRSLSVPQASTTFGHSASGMYRRTACGVLALSGDGRGEVMVRACSLEDAFHLVGHTPPAVDLSPSTAQCNHHALMNVLNRNHTLQLTIISIHISGINNSTDHIRNSSQSKSVC